MDHHVHGYVTDHLRAGGVDCLTAAEDQHEDEPDEVVLARATQLGRSLVTYDRDFFKIHDDLLARREHHAGVLRVDSAKRVAPGEILASLLLAAQAYDPTDMADRLERHPL